MKNLSLFAAAFFCSFALFAESSAVSSADSRAENSLPVFNWSLLWSGSWEEFSFASQSSQAKGTLHNRGEIKLNVLPMDITLRAQVLDRRPLIPDLEQLWGNPEKIVTNHNSGFYHKPTGSRLLFGVIDEWGLSARIRNPWIRSPPYAENHKPLIADLRTTVSATKEEEAYLYLSSTAINFFQDVKIKGFISAQTEIENYKPAVSGGMDISLPFNCTLLLEGFYTGSTLPQTKSSSWFSNPPPLPERDFRLYAAGLLFCNPLISLSCDYALSQTFAWGSDIYCNLGITLSPPVFSGSAASGSSKAAKRPLSISVAADGAGQRFVYRDGASHGAGFRSAAKIEWKGRRNALFRVNTTMRGPEMGEGFNRSSTGVYYRLPSVTANNKAPVRLTRISLTTERNAVTPKKTTDSLSGYAGFSINLRKFSVKTPLGVNFSGSIKGITALESVTSPYPVHEPAREFNSAGFGCEFTWFPSNYQFRSGVGYTKNAKNEEKWDYSLGAAVRFKHGRLGFKASSPEFPEKWNWTITYRLELK